MDIGLKGKVALVCAASKGLGFACAVSLAREGCDVILNGHDQGRLDEAVEKLKSLTGLTAHAFLADLNREEERQRLVTAHPDVDILINNNGGPPPGKFASFSRVQWLSALEANLLAPVHLMQALLPGMCQRGFGRVVNITSAMVKSPHPMMTLSTAPRAGLTAVAKAISRDVAKDNVTINNLLPERLDTDRQKFMAIKIAEEQGDTPENVRRRVTQEIPARRYGDPSEFGDMCAFLCSAQAGFITGQNIQLDGGAYSGLV